MISVNSVKNVAFEVFTVSLAIFILIFVYPLLIIFFVPCWIYRCLISYLVLRNPKYGRILKGIDATSAGKHPYSNPDCVLVPTFYFADKLNTSTVMKTFEEKIIGPGLYPELRQNIVRKYGYHFWQNIENFRIKDHVRNLNHQNPNMPITREQLNKETRKLIKLPFENQKSPWELIVVTNYMDDENPAIKSVFILRVQHCLMDGYSLYNLLMKFSDKPGDWVLKPSNNKKQQQKIILNDLINFAILIALGPYHFLKMFVFCNDHHEFVKNVFKPEYDDVWLGKCTSGVSKDRLISLRNTYGVSMSALITTLVSQAIYSTMKRANTQDLKKTLHGFLSYPLPGHKDILTNHFSIVRIPIHVNEMDPVKTLKSVEEEYRNLRNSAKPLVFFYVQNMIAIAPIGLRFTTTKLPPTTFVLTNFPGPPQPTDIFGCRLMQLNLTGKGTGGTAFMLTSLSTCNKFFFGVESPECNLPTQKDVDNLSKTVLETLTNLETRSAEEAKKSS